MQSPGGGEESFGGSPSVLSNQRGWDPGDPGSMHEMMALKTLEITAAAPAATHATRQASFFSSIQKASSEA
jgi:hypothetical protein